MNSDDISKTTDSTNQEHPPENRKQHSEQERPGESTKRAANNDQANTSKNDPSEHRLPLLVRILRVLWRRRKWRIIGGQQGASWAEISIVILTGGILLVGYGQYKVYKRQAGLMQDSLGQTERSVILNMGQIAIANRNAKTAEDTLNAQQMQFRMEQRPYIWLSPGIATHDQGMTNIMLPDLLSKNLPLAINVQAFNGGHSPAVDVRVTKVVLIVDTAERAKRRAENYVAEFIPGKGEVDIAPNTGFTLGSPEIRTITQEGLTDLQKDRMRIYVLARVQYRDIFSPPQTAAYETAFCARVNGSGMPFGGCDISQSWIK
jgi:hypothetical protein